MLLVEYNKGKEDASSLLMSEYLYSQVMKQVFKNYAEKNGIDFSLVNTMCISNNKVNELETSTNMYFGWLAKVFNDVVCRGTDND